MCVFDACVCVSLTRAKPVTRDLTGAGWLLMRLLVAVVGRLSGAGTDSTQANTYTCYPTHRSSGARLSSSEQQVSNEAPLLVCSLL